MHPQLLHSGATLEDERRRLPRDELVPSPVWEATRAVTIDAPAVEVWPWVAQMGYGRGGWYGWNPLDREDTGVFRPLAVAPPKVGDTWLDGRLHRDERSLDGQGRGPAADARAAFDARPDHRTGTGSGAEATSIHRRRMGVSPRRDQFRADAASCQDSHPHESALVHPCAQMDGRWRHGYAAKAARWDQDPSGDRPRAGGAEAHIARTGGSRMVGRL